MAIPFKDQIDMGSQKIVNVLNASSAQDAATLANITSAITTAAGNGLTESSGVLSVNTGTASATSLEVSSDTVRLASSGLGTGLTGGSGTAVSVNTSTIMPINNSWNSIAANTSTFTAETVWATTSSFAFLNNKAYRITVKCLVQSSVAADRIQVRVRKTDTSGATFADTFNITAGLANENYPVYFSTIITNTTGSTINAALVATCLRRAGTGNILVAASASNVAYLLIEEAGPSSGFSGATAIT